jgi:hypothetical protein
MTLQSHEEKVLRAYILEHSVCESQFRDLLNVPNMY